MHYLSAVDGSDESDRAVEYATSHVLAFDARLTLVHVLAPETRTVDASGMFENETERRQGGWEHLERAESVARDLAKTQGEDIEIETQLLIGRPAHAIVDFATDADVDAIYLGHRGASGDGDDRMGSVAKGVLDRASVPVTVVRRGALLPVE